MKIGMRTTREAIVLFDADKLDVVNKRTWYCKTDGNRRYAAF
jgi:hypothetical protein